MLRGNIGIFKQPSLTWVRAEVDFVEGRAVIQTMFSPVYCEALPLQAAGSTDPKLGSAKIDVQVR